MNTRRWLVLSLALNAALVGVVAWVALARHGGSAPFSVMQQLTNRTLRVRKVVRESAPVTVEVAAPFHWSEVESTDYRVYMANLRAIGCPERTIRDIIVMDLDQLYVSRLRELLAPLHREFWQLLAKFKDANNEVEQVGEKWEAMKKERAAVLKALFERENPFATDAEEGRTTEQRAHWAQVLDFLSAEKQDRVLSIRESFDAAAQKLWQTDHQLTGQEIESRKPKQRELEADRDRQLAEALTPEELAEYHLRTSYASDVCLRQSRVEFSEDEIRAIARATVERQEAEAKLKQNSPEAGQQRTELARQMETELKAALGASRYIEFERASDYRCENVNAVVARYGLPAATTETVYDLLRQAEVQASQLRGDNSRTIEERTASLTAIGEGTKRSVGDLLGPAALATYLQHGGDGWLQALAAPPK